MLDKVKQYIEEEPSITFDQYFRNYVLEIQDRLIEKEFGNLDTNFKDIQSVMEYSIESLR